jgi:GrpB-like predicted nucleotidyltransferase (UPF0157 family)
MKPTPEGITEYQPEWAEKFRTESEKIREVLGKRVEDIQHIGSTSIPGMLAKPLIDIAVLVDSIEDIPFFAEKLESIGYTYRSDMSSAKRIFLRKGDPLEYHLSITSPLYQWWDKQIAFRDYLRNHKEAVDEYNNLKLENLSVTPSEDLADLSWSVPYNSGKGEFVKKVLKLSGYSENKSDSRASS